MHHILIFTLTLFLAIPLSAKKKGAPPMSSGAPGDRTCLTSKCHAGNDLNSDKAKISIEGIPKNFVPNEVYDVTVHMEQAGMKKWGFQATVADEEGEEAGTLISSKDQPTQLLDDTRTKSRTSRRYISHTEQGIKGPEKGESQTWTFQWKAPADTTAVTPTFYFALNAANGNTKKTGDFIYTRQFEVKPSKD